MLTENQNLRAIVPQITEVFDYSSVFPVNGFAPIVI
jgi:hypothetical protein